MTMTLLADNTADTTDLASVSFTSSIDSTYKLYIFKFLDINPATDGSDFSFQVNATDSTGYDRTITSTYVFSAHDEGDAQAEVVYQTAFDQAQGTGFQPLADTIGNGSDESCAGTLWLFNPSNTTYVKHFYSILNGYYNTSRSFNFFMAGYINDTTAIDDIQFKMDSGNFDGTIKMYGVG